MMITRPSEAQKPNVQLTELRRTKAQGNVQWFEQAVRSTQSDGWVLLLGGNGPMDFRMRVAQSHARQDLLPSFWSHAAIVRRKTRNADWDLSEVSLEPTAGFGFVPKGNGVQAGLLARYDDPERFPNIACLRFVLPSARAKDLARSVERFSSQRSVVDMGNHLVEWLGFVWGAGERANPLLKGIGVPAAVFAESVFAMAGLELTPGISSQASCPEAIWQSAKWWHPFYESEAAGKGEPPSGKYCIGQAAAAVRE